MRAAPSQVAGAILAAREGKAVMAEKPMNDIMPRPNRYRRMHLDDMRNEADIRKDLEAVEVEMLARSPESRKLAQVCTERLAALASGWQPRIDEFAWISARINAVWAAYPDLQARKDDLYDEFLARCEAIADQPL